MNRFHSDSHLLRFESFTEVFAICQLSHRSPGVCARLIRQSPFYFILPLFVCLQLGAASQKRGPFGFPNAEASTPYPGHDFGLRPRAGPPPPPLDCVRPALSQPWQQAGALASQLATWGSLFARGCESELTLLPLSFKGRVIRMETVSSCGSVSFIEGRNRDNFVFGEFSVTLSQ